MVRVRVSVRVRVGVRLRSPCLELDISSGYMSFGYVVWAYHLEISSGYVVVWIYRLDLSSG